MTVEAETVVETPQALDITKVEEPFKTDKEVIALEEAEEKKDEEKKDEEKTEEEATEEVTEEKKDVKEKKKPVVNKKDFEEDVVYLFQLNRSAQIPSISPLCLQVESFLKLHGIKFENVDLKSKLWSKEGKMLPFIELNGEKIVDSNIFETLSKKFEKEIDANLTEDQKKVQEEMTEVVEKHLYWALVHWRSVDHENLLKGYKMVVPTTLGAQLPPAAIKVYFNYTYCRKGLKQVKATEFGTNTAEEIEQFGKDDLKKLSEKLGEQKFFFGDEVSSLDLVVFSYVSQIAMVEKEQPCAMREFLETDCKNLLALIEAVKEKVWGEDWEKATGEKIEMNPHIEVPLVVEEKEAEVEKVEEKATGEKIEMNPHIEVPVVVEEKEAEVEKVEEKKEEEGEEKKEDEEKVEDKEIKRNRGGTLSRIRGAFDMKKFAKAEKAEVKKEETEDLSKATEETENKEVEAETEKEVTEDKEDITDITEEKTEEKKKAGTLSRIKGLFDMKKVEKEEKEETEEEKPTEEGEAKVEGAEAKAETEEKTDEESPKKESTLTRMLSIFKKNKPVVVKKTTEEEELEEETSAEKTEEKETKEETSTEAKEIVTDIVNEIADDLKETEATKDLSKETEEL